MLKIKKIQEKESIIVSHQKDCAKLGKPVHYMDGDSCLNDCATYGKPT